jgi:Asp-tRNA(Asn)/Glu-tRNA(Gln) amidotransferase A subunit family amidase
MIHGRAFEDATVLRVAHAYEQASEWSACRPLSSA